PVSCGAFFGRPLPLEDLDSINLLPYGPLIDGPTIEVELRPSLNTDEEPMRQGRVCLLCAPLPVLLASCLLFPPGPEGAPVPRLANREAVARCLPRCAASASPSPVRLDTPLRYDGPQPKRLRRPWRESAPGLGRTANFTARSGRKSTSIALAAGARP